VSDWLVIIGIPAALLAFYPLVIGLAQLNLFRTKPQLLKQLHLGGWGLTLLLLICFMGWSISLRGQWLDAVPFGLTWLAAGAYFWRCRQQLSRLGKLYFGGWFGYPAALVLAYLADKIFFALVSLPLLAFLPTTTYYSGPTVIVRAPVIGFLGAKRVQLLTPAGFLFEKHRGFACGDLAPDLLATDGDSITGAKIQPGWRPDSVAVLLTTRRGQRLVMFSR
jgi:hypothetical protein